MSAVMESPMPRRVPTIHIYDTASARQLAQAPLFRRRRARIVVELDSIPESRRKQIEMRLDRLYNECGCTAGATAMLLALAALLAAWALPGDFPIDGLVMIPVSLAVAIAAAGVGKVMGLLLAKRALRIALDQLRYSGPEGVVFGRLVPGATLARTQCDLAPSGEEISKTTAVTQTRVFVQPDSD